MAITEGGRNRLAICADAIINVSEADLKAEINGAGSIGLLDGALSLGSDGVYKAFIAPFDWINEGADVVIVGVTPGRQQAIEALLQFQRAVKIGKSIDVAARTAKQAASFKGEMREIGVLLMDHFRLHNVFGIGSSRELFDSSARRAHYTSVLRYPVLRRGANYSGHRGILEVPFLRKMVEAHLPKELAMIPNAWIVPFGPTAHLVVEAMSERGVVDSARVLGGINHPSGTQWNRHNCQLNRADHNTCGRNVGCATIQQRSRTLAAKVEQILVSCQSPT